MNGEKTVVRGGYGILYLPTSERGYSDPNIGFTQTTNIATSANGFTPGKLYLRQSVSHRRATAGGRPAAGSGVGAGSAISGFEYNNPISYQQQWSFGVERSLTQGMSFNVNYAGGHGVDLPLSVRLNDLNAANYGPVGSSSQVSYLQAQVPNPFYGTSGIAPGSPLLNPTVAARSTAERIPTKYSAGTISSIQNSSLGIAYLDHGFLRTYSSLQATWLVNHRGGLTGSVSYVWSKLLGNVSDLTKWILESDGQPGDPELLLPAFE